MKDIEQLSGKTLSTLSKRISVPKYDRSVLGPSILHVGVGGFHRAHMAAYTDELLASGQGNWCIHGAGITPGDKAMARVLHKQDGLYTLIARSAQDEAARVIGSITEFFHGKDGSADLVKIVSAADYRIISLTVTEKGYHFTGDDRHLDFNHPDVKHDLTNPKNPKTAVGFLFRIAQLRLAARQALPTFFSCDNVPHNGSTLRNLILQYGREVDPEVSKVLSEEGQFPNCMVDRITPGTTDIDRSYLRRNWGIEDAWPVVCEDFRQWYIEDTFAKGRPAWDAVGAEFISDVSPFELMKIRLLNGSHSALSYLSYLLGYRRVDKAMADPGIREFILGYMAEIEPSVGNVPGIDLGDYQRILIERFSNPAVADQILRLCEDGSAKIPNMMLAPIMDILESGCPHGALAIAAWIRFLKGNDEEGNPIEIKDPEESRLRDHANRCHNDVEPFLSISSIFPPRLASNPGFAKALQKWYLRIQSKGMRKSLDEFLAET